MKTIKDILTNHIASNVTSSEKDVALFLSGGVDSTSLGIAAMKLGKQVHAYSFWMLGHYSYDYTQAQKTAEHFGWTFTGISINPNKIKENFRELITEWDCKKKTQVECTFPFLHLFKQIRENTVLSGVAADGHYGLSKKACLHFKEPKEKFDQFREDYFSQENPAGVKQLHLLAKHYGKKLIAPYLDPEVKEHFLQYDWYEINQPFQKHHVLEAFQEEFQSLGKLKKHLNLQLGSGIDKFFEQEILSNSSINFKARKRIMDVVRDWVKLKETQNQTEIL